jgi:hypothetical protein
MRAEANFLVMALEDKNQANDNAFDENDPNGK